MMKHSKRVRVATIVAIATLVFTALENVATHFVPALRNASLTVGGAIGIAIGCVNMLFAVGGCAALCSGKGERRTAMERGVWRCLLATVLMTVGGLIVVFLLYLGLVHGVIPGNEPILLMFIPLLAIWLIWVRYLLSVWASRKAIAMEKSVRTPWSRSAKVCLVIVVALIPLDFHAMALSINLNNSSRFAWMTQTLYPIFMMALLNTSINVLCVLRIDERFHSQSSENTQAGETEASTQPLTQGGLKAWFKRHREVTILAIGLLTAVALYFLLADVITAVLLVALRADDTSMASIRFIVEIGTPLLTGLLMIWAMVYPRQKAEVEEPSPLGWRLLAAIALWFAWWFGVRDYTVGLLENWLSAVIASTGEPVFSLGDIGGVWSLAHTREYMVSTMVYTWQGLLAAKALNVLGAVSVFWLFYACAKLALWRRVRIRMVFTPLFWAAVGVEAVLLLLDIRFAMVYFPVWACCSLVANANARGLCEPVEYVDEEDDENVKKAEGKE